MSRFLDLLRSDRFLVTAELNPPKSVDLSALLERAEQLRQSVDAFNITDSQSSVMTTAPLAVSHLLLDRGIEVILQLTCRDKNRIALQSDLLAASVLGIENVVCLTGDPPSTGDNPEAKPVFDLEAIGLLKAASALVTGKDMAGNEVKEAPQFNLGAVANPGASDLDKELKRMEEKIAAGGSFFQTQAIFDIAVLENFIRRTEQFRVPILAGIIILKSGGMARRMNENLPGVEVPDNLIKEMEETEDRTQKGIEIAGRLSQEIRSYARGVHIMAIGWERHIPRVLEQAGLATSQQDTSR